MFCLIRLLFVLCVSPLLLANITVSTQETAPLLVVADDHYPPYSYLENGQLTGIYIDILNAIFEKMPQYHLKIEATPWKRALKDVEEGRAFAIIPPYKYLDKRHYIAPYSAPILQESVVVVCHEQIKTRSNPLWPDDFFQLNIGINAGYAIGEDSFWQAVQQQKIRLWENQSTENNIEKLRKGRIDCYLNDRTAIFWTLNKINPLYRSQPHLAISERVLLSSQYGYLGLSANSPYSVDYREDFIQTFNTQLLLMQENGQLQQVIQRYLAPHETPPLSEK